MSKKIVEVVEAYERKFNPSDTERGLKIAHKEIAKKVKSLIEEKKIEPMKIDMKELYRKLVEDMDLEENIVSSAFPSISGEIISSVIIEGYQSFPKDVEKLVRSVPSKLKTSLVAGWTAMGDFGDPVKESEPADEIIPPDEKTHTVKNHLYERIISVTKEAIFFDQTGQLLDRARQIGERAMQKRQKIIFETVCDVNSTSLSNAVLYSTGNANLLTTNPLDTAGWEAADHHLTGKKDDKGEPIWVFGDMPVLIVAANLKSTARKLKLNQYGPLGTANLDANLAQNAFDYVVNPYLAVSNTSWWYGAFNRQFRWEDVWAFTVMSRNGEQSEDGFKRRIINQTKASFYGGCGAADTVWVVESNA